MFDEKKYMKEYHIKNKEKIKEQTREYREKNREKLREKKKKYYQKNREKILKQKEQYRKENHKKLKERDKNFRKNNPKKIKKWELKRNYDLSYEDWLKIWEIQDGKCAICGEIFIKPSNAYVDHNHETGEIRGLLCMKCNGGIGFLNDDPKLTAKATEYLLRRK